MNIERIEQQTRKELDLILADIPVTEDSEEATGFRAIHAAMVTGKVTALKANNLWNRFRVIKHERPAILAAL